MLAELPKLNKDQEATSCSVPPSEVVRTLIYIPKKVDIKALLIPIWFILPGFQSQSRHQILPCQTINWTECVAVCDFKDLITLLCYLPLLFFFFSIHQQFNETWNFGNCHTATCLGEGNNVKLSIMTCPPQQLKLCVNGFPFTNHSDETGCCEVSECQCKWQENS